MIAWLIATAVAFGVIVGAYAAGKRTGRAQVRAEWTISDAKNTDYAVRALDEVGDAVRGIVSLDVPPPRPAHLLTGDVVDDGPSRDDREDAATYDLLRMPDVQMPDPRGAYIAHGRAALAIGMIPRRAVIPMGAWSEVVDERGFVVGRLQVTATTAAGDVVMYAAALPPYSIRRAERP